MIVGRWSGCTAGFGRNRRSVSAAAVGAVPEAFGPDPPRPLGLDHNDAIAELAASWIPYLTAFEFDFNLGLHFGPSLMSSLGEALATIR